MRSSRAIILLVVSLTIATGCGDDDDSPAVTADGGASAQTWPGTCDPVLQNCPVGQQCTGGCNVTGVMAKVFTCAIPNPAATATNGQDCGLGCARGHDCYTVADADGITRNVCRKYCNVDADCPTGSCLAEGLVCTAGDLQPIGRICAL
jgi:hypothetical protein